MDDLNEIKVDVACIKKDVSTNTKDLSEHIRRTNILEKSLKPVQTHVAHIEGGMKLVGGIAVLITIITGILKLVNMFPL